jgi:hypothetical protein
MFVFDDIGRADKPIPYWLQILLVVVGKQWKPACNSA